MGVIISILCTRKLIAKQLDDFSQDAISSNKKPKNQHFCYELFYPPFLTTSSIKTNLLSRLLLNQYPEVQTSAKFFQASPIAESMEPFVYQALSATLTMGTDH